MKLRWWHLLAIFAFGAGIYLWRPATDRTPANDSIKTTKSPKSESHRAHSKDLSSRSPEESVQQGLAPSQTVTSLERAPVNLEALTEKHRRTQWSPQNLKELPAIFAQPGWKLWSEAKALPLGQIGESESVIGIVGGYGVLPSSQEGQLEDFGEKDYLVAFNQRTLQPGVINGTVLIELKEISQWEELKQRHQLVVVESFQTSESLHLLSVKSELSRVNLLRLIDDLKREPAIGSVKLEVVGPRYEAF